MELRILPDGRVLAIGDDDTIDFMRRALGPPHVARASYVEWDQATALWAVADSQGRDTGRRFRARAQALAWERRNFWRLIDSGAMSAPHICAAKPCKGSS